MKASIDSIESFGLVDGPGIRTVIFFNGCKLRCNYCHNPEMWNKKEENYSVDDIVNKVKRFKPYYRDNGGVTYSGGEPLLQIDFLIELFTQAKKEGVHTTLDTCGQPFTFEEPFFSKFKQLMKVTDLVLLDIKHIDEKAHKELTGHTNQNILEFAKYLSDIQKPVWIRHVLVPTINTDEVYLKRLHQFVAQLKNVERVEVLPYHTLGAYKWKELGLEYPLEGIPTPSDQQLQIANTILETGK